MNIRFNLSGSILGMAFLLIFSPSLWAYTCEQEVARTYFKLVDKAKNNRNELTHFFSEKNMETSRLFYEQNYYDGPFRGLDTVNDYIEYKISFEVPFIVDIFKVLSYAVEDCGDHARLEIYYFNVIGNYKRKVIDYSFHNGRWLIDSQLIVAVDKDDVRGVELNYPIHSEEMEGCLIDAYLIKDPDMRLLEYYACFDSIEDPEIVPDK